MSMKETIEKQAQYEAATEAFDRLQEMESEIEMMMREAESLVRRHFPHLYDRASGYWIGQIKAAVNGNSMCPMSDTLEDCEYELANMESEL